MKNKILIFAISLLFFIPISVNALSENYTDIVSKYTNVEVDSNKVSLYLFYGRECPHCEEEREWLDSIKDEYNDILEIHYFEVWHDSDNKMIMQSVGDELSVDTKSVPFNVIGDKYYIGFSDAVKSRILNQIDEYRGVVEEENKVNIPMLGDVDIKNVSIPLVAVILGFIDGFNPCAMWILLFLINLLFKMDDKKKAWILGLTFLFISALVYFVSMLGINIVLGVATISWMKIIIALFILSAGILNLRKYLKIRKQDAGCSVVNNERRKTIISRMQKIIKSKSFLLSMIGIITLAVSVNLIEMACSLGFPVVFNELLTVNNVSGITKIIYLLIYVFFYMIDDMTVFTISMVTVEATGITNKYNKLCTLVSSIIMIVMGLLLIFKPEWLMLNF